MPPFRVCLVTDRRRLAPDARTCQEELRALSRQVAEAIGGGADLIQVRERDMDAAALAALVRELVTLARGSAARIVVNDRADVAIVAGAHGVHLPAAGLPTARARALGGPAWIAGRSIHTVEEARQESAADYLIFGTAFPSVSKGEGRLAAGVEALREAVAAARVPMLAIGGIDVARARECAEAGAAGAAAIGLFLPRGRAPGAIGPRQAAIDLRGVFALGDGT